MIRHGFALAISFFRALQGIETLDHDHDWLRRIRRPAGRPRCSSSSSSPRSVQLLPSLISSLGHGHLEANHCYCRQPRTAPAVGNPPFSQRAGPPTAETASSARSPLGSPRRSNPPAPLPPLPAESSHTKLPHSQPRPRLPRPPVRPRNRGSSSRAVAVPRRPPSSTSYTKPSLLPPRATNELLNREATATRNSCPLTHARSSLSTRAPYLVTYVNRRNSHLTAFR